MLTDMAIRKAKPGAKGYKLADERGLHLFISTTGAKSFRLKYRYGGREKLLTFGQWPDVSLSRARELATAARSVLSEGRDPGIVKRQDIAARTSESADTFEAVAREHHRKKAGSIGARQAKTIIDSLERELFPALGALPISEIGVKQLMVELDRIEARGAIEAAHRLRQRADAIFTYAIARGRASINPAAQLKGTLTRLSRIRKQPASTNLADARRVYADCIAYPAAAETRACIQLLAMTAARPGEARGAEWAEFTGLGGDAPVWRIPAARRKGDLAFKADSANDHFVPLAPEAVAVVVGIHPLTGHCKLLFPSPRDETKMLTDNTLSVLMKRAGHEGRHVPHGWRAAFSTIMNELHPDQKSVIDAILGHAVGGVEGRYNRAEHLRARRPLLEEWARLLTGDANDTP